MKRVLILGAAGRDFHDFNTVFRDDPTVEVVGFTATQIPGIDSRTYPAALSGARYPKGVPIFPEEQLEKLIRELKVDEVIMSYSDTAHATVMHLASRALAAGASFRLLTPKLTMLPSKKKVIAVTAARTGCGKSQAARYVARAVKAAGKKVVVVRHPMPYGDLVAQRVQRFTSVAELDKAKVTIEEREDYEPHVMAGFVIYAGVDYAAILAEAEKEADVVIWDGGNNDAPFFKPDLWICVVDPHRPGHELGYHPGETNVRAADVVLINKADTAPQSGIDTVRENVRQVNPKARVVLGASKVTADDPKVIEGKKVLLIDDGPTLTHGEMQYGAGKVAADRYGARELADPRPYAVGLIKDTYKKYTHLGAVLPAVGYSEQQVKDLEATIRATPAEGIVIATPIDLSHVLKLDKPATRIRYELEDMKGLTLGDVVKDFLK